MPQGLSKVNFRLDLMESRGSICENFYQMLRSSLPRRGYRDSLLTDRAISPMPRQRSILLVCTANICRSPMAEGILRKYASSAGLRLDIDSAATHDYMVGMPPFPLAVATAKRRGCDITQLVARTVRAHDFNYFDLILGMQRDNVACLKHIAPPESRRKIRLLLDYANEYRGEDVPDPYGGGPAHFDLALDMIADGCLGLVRSLLPYPTTAGTPADVGNSVLRPTHPSHDQVRAD
jgi:protein-tyrosine phosphatase